MKRSLVIACVMSLPHSFCAQAASASAKSHVTSAVNPVAASPHATSTRKKLATPLMLTTPSRRSNTGWYLGVEGGLYTNRKRSDRAVTKSSMNHVGAHMSALIDAKHVLCGLSLLAGYGRHNAMLSESLSAALDGRKSFSSHYIALGMGLKLGWQITQNHSLAAYTTYRFGIRVLREQNAYADARRVMMSYQNSALASYIGKRLQANSPVIIDNDLSSISDDLVNSELLNNFISFLFSQKQPSNPSGGASSSGSASSPSKAMPAVDSWSYSAIVLPCTQHFEYGLEYAYTLKTRFRFAVSVGGLRAMHHFFSGFHISGSVLFRVA